VTAVQTVEEANVEETETAVGAIGAVAIAVIAEEIVVIEATARRVAIASAKPRM
jgi:hypothetical protein